jgi:HSP20 family protein
VHAVEISHGREPEIEERADHQPGSFENSAHRYDCLMAPRRDIDRLKSEMEELFADLCQVPRLVARRAGFRPALDVYRTDDPPVVTVVVELAGVDPAEVEAAVVDGILIVRGRRHRSSGEHRLYQHMELDYGVFERRVQLNEPIDSDAASATYENGLLSIHLPLAEASSGPVRVTIQSGSEA